MALGRFDDAKKTLETALKLQDSASARINLFVIGMLTNDQAARRRADRGHARQA